MTTGSSTGKPCCGTGVGNMQVAISTFTSNEADVAVGPDSDLHPGNILVTERYYPTDINKSEITYLLTDFGEGKRLNDTCAHEKHSGVTKKSYGREECKAPEVRDWHDWSEAADMWALGANLCDVLQKRWELCGSSESVAANHSEEARGEGSHYRVPSLFRDVGKRLLASDPKDRPRAHDFLLEIEDGLFEEKLRKGEVQWVVWNWGKELQEARATAWMWEDEWESAKRVDEHVADVESKTENQLSGPAVDYLKELELRDRDIGEEEKTEWDEDIWE
jgi:Protein kinase domain